MFSAEQHTTGFCVHISCQSLTNSEVHRTRSIRLSCIIVEQHDQPVVMMNNNKFQSQIQDRKPNKFISIFQVGLISRVTTTAN
ncbi:uncharacterized protein J3R85_012578 [Psidium guajava]|nr:uncharacterized protein J3R85_012578 [Psidium guajava]